MHFASISGVSVSHGLYFGEAYLNQHNHKTKQALSILLKQTKKGYS